MIFLNNIIFQRTQYTTYNKHSDDNSTGNEPTQEHQPCTKHVVQVVNERSRTICIFTTLQKKDSYHCQHHADQHRTKKDRRREHHVLLHHD